MRLKVESLPNAMDRRGRESDRSGHRTQTPVRRIPRRRLQRQANRLGDRIIADLARRPWTRFVQQSLDPPFREPPSPLAHGIRRSVHPCANVFVFKTLSRQQHNPRALSQALRRPPTRRQPLKFTALAFAQVNANSRLAHRTSSANQRMDNRIYFSIMTLGHVAFWRNYGPGDLNMTVVKTPVPRPVPANGGERSDPSKSQVDHVVAQAARGPQADAALNGNPSGG